MKITLFLTSLALLVPMLLSCDAVRTSEDRQQAKQAEELPPLIDREVFFDDPRKDRASLSPDGELIAFRQEHAGSMNIWVKETGEPFAKARPLTEEERPVRSFFWSRDSESILYVQDHDGDENYNLYSLDPRESWDRDELPEKRALTDYRDVQTRVLKVPEDRPGYVIVGINDRNPQLHDVYRIDIESGEKELLFRNEHNISSWSIDDKGRIRFASRQTPEGGREILRVADDELERVYKVNFGESARVVRLHEDEERVYLVTNKGEDVDLTRLVLFDPDSGDKKLVEKDPEGEVDFGGAIFSRRTDELLATHYVGDKRRMYFHDQGFEEKYRRISEQLPEGEIRFRSRTEDEDLWLISLSRDIDPGTVYLYDSDIQETEKLYRFRPDLNPEHLAPMEPISYEARDGLQIPAYLTTPRGIEAEGLPLVVLPHGGPWVRDTWGYDAEAQFLANRGYAVLQPNFRGSSGYGKEFLNAGNKEWGTGYMQQDITDGVKYLKEKGLADPDKVGIYGTSYGGFATLAGLAFTPELYAAGASKVGPSNIISLIESVPPYWKPVIKEFHLRVGDPEDPGDRQRLKEQSPLFSAENIRAPLLVAQGANDPRVPQRESDQIVAALRDLDRDVRYIVAPDEGHGFARSKNRLAFYAELEEFFSNHLNGRYQREMGEEIERRLQQLIVDVEEVEAPRQ